MRISVTNVWVVARREFLDRVRKKSFLIMTIIIPVLFGALMVLPSLLLMRTEKAATIEVLDHTGWAGTLLTEKVTPSKQDEPDDQGNMIKKEAEKSVKKAGRFVLAPKGATLEGEKKRLMDKKIDGLLVLNPDPKRDLSASYYGMSLGNINLMGLIRSRIDRVALRHRLEARGLDPGIVSELEKTVKLKTVKVNKEGKTSKGSFMGEYFKALGFSFLLYLLILPYGFALMRGVMEEKTGKIAEVIVSAVRPFELLLGKILGIASVGLAQYAIWFILGAGLVFANPMNFTANAGSAMITPGEVVLLVLYYLLGFIFFASIYGAMGAVCSTDQEAQQMNLPIVMCLVLPIILMGAIMQTPNAGWVVVLSMIPLFSPTLMVMRASLVEVPLWQISASLGFLVLGVVVMAYIGGKIFRVGILMTGKRPSIPEILRWVRAS